MKPPSDPKNTNPIKACPERSRMGQFHLPPKPPIFSQNNSPSILPGQRTILHNHQALAVCFAGFIHVNSAACLFYHFNGLGYLIQLWDLEYFATLAAVYPSVGGTAIKQPGSAAFRALGDNLHRYIPYTNSRILNKEHLLELTLSQNILLTPSIVIHQKFIYCPITFLLTKRYHLIYKEQKSVAEFGEIFLDLDS